MYNDRADTIALESMLLGSLPREMDVPPARALVQDGRFDSTHSTVRQVIMEQVNTLALADQPTMTQDEETTQKWPTVGVSMLLGESKCGDATTTVPFNLRGLSIQ